MTGAGQPFVITVALYRWYDSEDVLIYIGITGDMTARQTAHSKRSIWGHFAARCAVERFPDYAEAEAAEQRAIAQERPIFNRRHNDTPEAVARVREYMARHDPTDLLNGVEVRYPDGSIFSPIPSLPPDPPQRTLEAS